CLKAAVADTSGLAPCIPKYKIHDLLPAARRDKNALGYIPCDRHNESVARALEYAYDDWCTARLAERAGDRRTRRKYDRMAKAYRHYFDTRTGFMRGRDSRNRWRTPFDPFRSEHRSDDYCEGTAWQWSWFVPHDVAGLMRLMGGRRTFAARLDSLFTAPSELRGNVVSADITGLIGQYAHGNEPGHHIPYLYNYAGRHDRTQMIVNTILQTLYANAPNGLAGNEDCGQMSAWYVLSALGLYQVCPGKAEWTVGRPLFSEATVLLPLGKRLVVRAIPCPETSRHAPRIRFNGKRLRRPFIAHRKLMEGGVLEVEVL
ncbi:glycoside hydrolase family 92 protein, partial [Prevotella sp. MGM2]|uniref:glycoside hydrolase family 92 protein n=1 Tax=Prevotella sp. MGM2 TaxID=2033406 RepID=UPI000D0C1B00